MSAPWGWHRVLEVSAAPPPSSLSVRRRAPAEALPRSALVGTASRPSPRSSSSPTAATGARALAAPVVSMHSSSPARPSSLPLRGFVPLRPLLRPEVILKRAHGTYTIDGRCRSLSVLHLRCKNGLQPAPSLAHQYFFFSRPPFRENVVHGRVLPPSFFFCRAAPCSPPPHERRGRQGAPSAPRGGGGKLAHVLQSG